MNIINEIQKDYVFKNVGIPEYYLRGNFHTAKDIDNVKEERHDEHNKHLSTQ